MYVFLRKTTSSCIHLVVCFCIEMNFSWHSWFLFILTFGYIISERNEFVMTLLIFIYLNVWFYVFGNKWLCHDTLNFYSFCFSFHLEVTWSLRVFHFFKEKRDIIRKNPCYIIHYLKRNNCVVKTLYRVCIIANGNDHVMKYFNNYLL